MRTRIMGFGMAAMLISLAHANCGLEHCPLHHGESEHSHSVSLNTNHTSFNLDSAAGRYEAVTVGYTYMGFPHWLLGGNLSAIALRVGSETEYGISNPLLFASWFTRWNPEGVVYLGLQLELPLGNEHAGMASHHFMVAPYVLMEQSFGSAFGNASLGYSQAVSLHEHEESEIHPLYVNPHEDQEILYRMGTGLRQNAGRFKEQVYLDGRYAPGDLELSLGRRHLCVGALLEAALGKRLAAGPKVELPLISPKRFDWKAGLEVKGVF